MFEEKDDLANILIVDDEPEIVWLLTTVLMEKGYKVYQANDGNAALDIATLNQLDLILLDLMMPVMDGYEVCQRLKFEESTREIPVIFLSGSDETFDKVRAFASGGVDYITKPWKLAEVLARVENQLKISRLQIQLQQQNQQLQTEIFHRQAAETKLKTLNQQLEALVLERTTELQEQNQQLINLQLQLKKSLENEKSLSELKSQLLNTISHQFRTPLMVISTTSDLLHRKLSRLNINDYGQYFDKISDGISRFETLLEDVLTLAKINAKAFKIEPAPLNLTAMCEKLLKSSKLGDNSNHQLIFLNDNACVEKIWADPNLLKKALAHLLNNAIRYSPDGGAIVLEISSCEDAVTITFQDQGIGIPKLDQEKVFDSFYRASNANLIPGSPGSGLGLPIAKWVIENHGGTLTIISEENHGTTVNVYLPINHFKEE
ncbi:hybrid sensor histidine kinase/response regulator [Ancylothrix sp. C2]|uniref:hybrid sensor histidine kinase/response regulator n=1 Tax=Ancylothrix sp. D3o TaxID=2953691 RepID=UPI0021BB7DD3|nr:hybrid sensor histidine kinase/response regulator [Ancylothrix sp. D3o]MCT7949117.1 hybrid sensor histidine kinase/response regulator [Ancylothrix sp. D3o]